MQNVTTGSMLALAILMLNITTFLLILRLLGRRKQKLPIGIDDICAIFSWIGVMVLCINMIIAVAYQRWGVALAVFAISKSDKKTMIYAPQYLESMHFQFVQETTLPLQLMFAKLSIIFFYRRLLCPDRRGFVHWATLLTAGFTIFWGISMFLLWLLQCGTDIPMYWNSPSLELHNKCWGVYNTIISTSSDCLLDVVIFVIPTYPLSRLRISMRKKVLVMGVFATGALSVAASVIRVWAYAAAIDRSNHTFSKTNTNLVLSLILFWGLIEAGFAVIAACLPSTKFWLDTAVAKATGREKFGAYTKSCGSGNSTPRTIDTPRTIGTPRTLGTSPGSPYMADKAFRDVEKGDTVTVISVC